MTSLGWQFLAFGLRLAACLAAGLGILGSLMIFGLHGLSTRVVLVALAGAFVGAVLVVVEDHVLWRARAELRRETGALR